MFKLLTTLQKKTGKRTPHCNVIDVEESPEPAPSPTSSSSISLACSPSDEPKLLAVLPEELLDAVVKSLLQEPVFIERELPRYRGRYGRADVISLSLVNRQLRRICTPFLFGYIKLRGRYLEAFLTKCIDNKFFALSINTLSFEPEGIRGILLINEDKFTDKLIRILSYLKNLSQINLNRIPTNARLLDAFHHHPTLTTVFVDVLSGRDISFHSEMKKFVLGRTIVHDRSGAASLALSFAPGVRLYRLAAKTLDDVKAYRFHGLVELELAGSSGAIDDTALSHFTHTHPSLKKILFGKTNHLNDRSQWQQNISPYILPFLDEIHRKELDHTMTIEGFSITRTKPADQTTVNQWTVTGLHLAIIESPSGPILDLVHSWFHQISVLTIEYRTRSPPVLEDDLIASLSPFASLRVVSLLNTLDHLYFGTTPSRLDFESQSQRRKKTGRPDLDEMKEVQAMVWYTTRIARSIPSIEAFYIRQHVTYRLEESDRIYEDSVAGWIEASKLRSPNGVLSDFVPPIGQPLSRTTFTRYVHTPFYV